MLKLRRGTVVREEPLTVRIEGAERRAWADESMIGEVRAGDEVIVNTEALDLGLGSGGFDVVHANLTRGLEGSGAAGAEVMKLNYTSLQHAVDPVEARDGGEPLDGAPPDRRIPVLVLSLHGQLAPAAWAAARSGADLRVGYLQTPGGALPGRLSRDVAELRRSGLLCGHLTAGPCHGGEAEAISVIGGLEAAARGLGWDAVIAGPGPGVIGSGSRLGHGGMEALDTAHAALSLGMETLLAPRLSSGDLRDRHRGLSHHSETVLRLLLGEVTVPVPDIGGDAPARMNGGHGAIERLREVCGARHRVSVRPVALGDYADSGLPAETMGRGITEDRLFFASALAAGDALEEAVPVGISV